MTMAKPTVFSAEWEDQMEAAREAYKAYTETEAHARAIMEKTTDSGATTEALDKMSKAATVAHKTWVKANPIRWARTHATPPLSVPVLAPLVNVSEPSLFAWEHGGVKNPEADGMRNLERVLHEPTLGELWQRWRAIPTESGANS